MTVSWGGFGVLGEGFGHRLHSPDRYTYELMELSDQFCICFFDALPQELEYLREGFRKAGGQVCKLRFRGAQG